MNNKLNQGFGKDVAQNFLLDINRKFYFALIGVGSNNQEQKLLLDTASYDFSVQTTLNKRGVAPCEPYGVFDNTATIGS